MKFTGLGKGGTGLGKLGTGLDIRGSNGTVGTDNLKCEQCLGIGGALQSWEHFLIEIFDF